MAGYSAMASVDRGRVRTIAWTGRAPDVLPEDAVPSARSAPVGADPVPGAVTAVEEPSPPIPFGERAGRFRDQVVMTMFFVTDPESWR